MKRLVVALVAVGLMLGPAAVPAGAASERVAIHCDEYLVAGWDGGREWVDADGVYHIRGGEATYLNVGDALCAGVNRATLQLLNLDLATGMGNVIARGHMTVSAVDGGWDGLLNAHMTPAGPAIWVGTIVAQGYGELAGWQYRAEVVELEHWWISIDGFVFEPGS